MKPISFALLGCGDIAKAEHIAISQVPGAYVGIVMDTNGEHAETCARRIGTSATTSLEDVLQSDVDVVVIAVPHYLHRDLAVRAAEAGKHIILEKPISVTEAEGQEIVEASRKNGVLLSVAYVQRYRPANVAARQIVQDGIIGDISHVHVVDLFSKPKSYWTGGYSGMVHTDWRGSRKKSGGGVWLMNMSHAIDYLLNITGLEPDTVAAVVANRNTPFAEVEDDVAAIMRFKGGAAASMSASTVAVGDPRSEELILGTNGSLRLGSPLQLSLQEPRGDYPSGMWISVPVEEGDPWQDGRNEFFRLFSEALRTGSPPPVPGEEALRVLEIVLATYRAGESGTVISV